MAAGLGRGAEGGRDRGDPDRRREEHRLAQRRLPVCETPRWACSFSTACSVRQRELVGCRVDLRPGGVAERHQVGVELGDVGAVSPTRRSFGEAAVGGGRAVEQHDGLAVHLVRGAGPA